MRNKIVGYIIIGIALVLAFIIYSYHNTLIGIAGETCSIQGPSCPHLQESNQQLTINLIILGIMVLIGLYLIFFGQEEKIVTKLMRVQEQIKPNKISKKNYQKIMESLTDDEKKILGIVIDAQGSVFQSELVSKTGMGKVTVTRILDRLEGKNLIERKRRGMTNIVILKH